jgi:hypothetical protein
MPLPKTTNVGKIIEELNQSKTKRGHEQKVAIALNQARKSGANIPLKNEISRRAKKS